MSRRRSGAQAIGPLTARFKRTLWYAECVTQRTVRESTQINDAQMLYIAYDIGRFEHDMSPDDLHIYRIVSLLACERTWP